MTVPESTSAAATKRERTRAALVAAALQVAQEKGFAQASLEEIAARAGMTKGAIYSNFESKAELMLAAVMASEFTVAGGPIPGATVREQFATLAAELAAMLGRVQGSGQAFADFQVYALGDPELRRRLAQLYRQGFEQAAPHYANLKGLRRDLSPRDVAVGVQALLLGFLLQSFLSPADVTETSVGAFMAAVADGLTSER